MKRCGSPANTSCMYQRIARDQAPDDNAGAQQAYADLFQHLSNDSEGQAMLKHLMNCLTNDGAMDEPLENEPAGGVYSSHPKVGRVEPNRAQAHDSRVRAYDTAELRRRVAASAQGRAQAEAAGFAARFPGAMRIRNV